MGSTNKRLIAGFGGAGLMLGAAAYGGAMHPGEPVAAPRAESRIVEPVAGLGCGWEARPCQLAPIVVRVRG